MITSTALEAQNRMRADKPVVVVLTRRRATASDDAIRFVTAAARDEQIEAIGVDVDDPANAAFLDDMRASFVPEVLVCQRGVVLERSGVSSADDARALFASALRRNRTSLPPTPAAQS